MLIYQILEKYNKYPFYYIDDYLSINDDRFGRVVSFKLYEENKNIYVDFKDKCKYNDKNNRNIKNVNIISLEDFQEKWYKFYHCLI